MASRYLANHFTGESKMKSWDKFDEEAFKQAKAIWKADRNRIAPNLRRIDSKNRCVNRGTMTKNNWKKAS